jgi:hypothetical protein
MKKDTSKEIFNSYYQNGNRFVCLTLKDGKILIGKFIGFFRGDEENGDPYIFRWHFLEKRLTVFDYDQSIDEEQGIYINQSEIESVTFQ